MKNYIEYNILYVTSLIAVLLFAWLAGPARAQRVASITGPQAEQVVSPIRAWTIPFEDSPQAYYVRVVDMPTVCLYIAMRYSNPAGIAAVAKSQLRPGEGCQ